MSVMHITKANYDELVKNSDKPVLYLLISYQLL